MLGKTSDFACLEAVAASALLAGRAAAVVLSQLQGGPLGRTTAVRHRQGLLTGPRLFELLALETLDGLVRALDRAADAESWWEPACGERGAKVPLGPVQRLTAAGQRIERVRGAVALAVERACYTLDLVHAEGIVGRARGLVA